MSSRGRNEGEIRIKVISEVREREVRVRSQEDTVNEGTDMWQDRDGCYYSELPWLALSWRGVLSRAQNHWAQQRRGQGPLTEIVAFNAFPWNLTWEDSTYLSGEEPFQC